MTLIKGEALIRRNTVLLHVLLVSFFKHFSNYSTILFDLSAVVKVIVCMLHSIETLVSGKSLK